MLLYIHYYGYSKISTDRMPLKAAATTTLRELDLGNDTSIVGLLEPDSQVITMG